MNLIESFDALFAKLRPHFNRPETYERARALAISSLVTYGRHTITRLICSRARQLQDWSADYKFYSKREWDAQALFFEVLKHCDPHSHWPEDAVVMAMDDSLYRKTGKQIASVRTLRDPMSLPFHTNLIRGVRFIQASVLITPEDKLQYARAIPVYFEEAPPAKKPGKRASKELKEQFKQTQKENRISILGHQAALQLRKQVDQLPGGKSRRLFLTVDGSYCNGNFLRDLPNNIIAIARARKDLKLFAPISDSERNRMGRHRIYGEQLPTPEEIRQNNDIYLWQTARVFAVGKYHNVRYKVVAPVLWKKATLGHPQRLIIIAPLRYRNNATAPLLYRKPAYLLTPDLESPIEFILQYYFFRWDIEVNHRDEKSLMGLGDAQVRSPKSVKRQPRFSVLIYSLLMLASIQAYGARRTDDYLPLPKWRKKTDRRPSTLDIVGQFRREAMLMQLQKSLKLQQTTKPEKKRRKRPRSNIEARKRGFVNDDKERQSVLKLPINIISALLYADS